MLRRVLVAGWLVLALLLARGARAIGDPTLDWWTIETKHFRIHYERGLEPVAERVARLAEDIHERLIGPLGYSPPTITHITLTDSTDSANGSATAVPFNSIRLFVTAPGDLSPLNDYDDWYLGLLTHEYTHVLHTDNVSGIPAVANAILGKTIIPNQAQPRWIIEGLAVVAESRYSSAGRIRSTLFDAYMRADVLAGNIARLDQISSSPRRWPQGTLWYLYGSQFLQWIVNIYGLDVMRAISADYGASLVPFGINRAIRRQTGRTYVQLYEGFKDTLRRGYAKQMRRVKRRGLREGQRITFHGRDVHYPRFIPKAARALGSSRRQLLYFRNDFDNRAGFYRLDLGKSASETLFARSSSENPPAFTHEGDLLFSSRVPYRQINRYTELFRLPVGKRAPRGSESYRQQLTIGSRATAPTINRHGDVVYTTNGRGSTTLKIAKLSEGKLTARRTLVRNEGRFDQAFTPRFSPDGEKVAYSVWTAGGYRDIRVVDIATGKIDQVTHDRALDTGPCWSPDGKQLYFASDRTGISNIYEFSLGSRRLLQDTNVRTMAVMPTVSEDGRMLVYVGYTHKGYDLYAMDLDSSRYLKALPAPKNRADKYADPPNVPVRKRRYTPWATLRPHAYSFEYAPGNFDGNQLTLSAVGADVAGHHSVSLSVVADPAAPVPGLFFNYTYGRLPVDLSLRLSLRASPRRDYRFNDLRPTYIERAYGVRTGISYRDAGEFASQGLSLTYTYAILDSEFPVASAGPLDPYASVTNDPLRGTIGTVHLGYSLTNTEFGFTAPGGVRGWALSLGLDVADEATASEETFYAATYTVVGYLPMPWPGNHVLALRSGGGMSKGSYSRRGTFFVGGYNLENVGFLDTLTSGIFNGAFVLRGYPPGVYAGSSYLLKNLEYRIPIANIDRGPSTLPVYARRIDGNLFIDYGGAFDKLRTDVIELFEQGDIVSTDQLHTAIGAELWLGSTIAYVLDVNLRLGYALGLSNDAIPGGQAYFVASSGF